MAIKAKIKATALGPLFMDFLSIFFAAKRDYGAFYHPKKFHTFWCSLSTKKCWWTGCCENGCPVFRTFFALAAFISHRKRKNFGNCTLA